MIRLLTKQGATKLYLVQASERSCKCAPVFLKKFQASSPSLFLTLNRYEHSQSTFINYQDIPTLTPRSENVVTGSETREELIELLPARGTETLGESATTSSENVVQATSVSENLVGASSSGAVDEELLIAQALENIPAPPVIPELEFVSPVTEAVISLASNGEPTLASIGLGSWWPSGIVQHCLHFLHCSVGLPWWAAIGLGTVIVRFALFPVVVKAQRNTGHMHNHMPQMQRLQVKMTEARQMGNAYMAAKYGNDLAKYMQEHNLNPLKSMLVPLCMAPIFISCFFGIRGMTNVPVESMKTGGLAWFSDLTVMDPYYILPLVCSATLYATLKTGADGGLTLQGPNANLMKYVVRGIPLIMLPFIYSFPAGVLCYWVSTNAVSLLQVSILRIPSVRQYLDLPILIKHDPSVLPQTAGAKKGFVNTAKESWKNMQVSKEMEERQNFDQLAFKRAGRAPIPKTYKYDPTKAKLNAEAAIQAKSSSK